jgi:hypothetical protein
VAFPFLPLSFVLYPVASFTQLVDSGAVLRNAEIEDLRERHPCSTARSQQREETIALVTTGL